MNQTLWYITPDMLVQALVYLSAACALRLFLPDSSWKHSAALGLTLGLGYLAKAAMFPAALLLIAILFLKPPKDALGRRHSVIALACFCLRCRPAGAEPESRETPLHLWRFRQTELRLVCRPASPIYSGWNGQPPENGTPAHAPRTDQRVSRDSRISQPGERHPAASGTIRPTGGRDCASPSACNASWPDCSGHSPRCIRCRRYSWHWPRRWRPSACSAPASGK